MFHTSHIHVPRNGRPSALRTFFPSSSFGTAETKEPLRRGILFTTVASVLLLVGSILTWLGFNDVFGGRVSMTGPLLIALALLLLLLSMRQFLIARKRNNSTRNGLQLGQMGRGTVTAVVVDRNDGVGAVTVVMDSHSLDQEPHFRNSASSNLEDYEPPSYSEVTQCHPSNIPPAVVCQEDPPPPYEEAVVGEGSRVPIRTSSQPLGEELAPAYSPNGHSAYDRGGSIMTIPGQIPGTQCYHCCMLPTSTTSAGRLSPHALCARQVLGSQDLASGAARPWSSPRRFLLIPHFLGIFANGRGDPAHSMTGELPPAYQPVDTTGRSPLTYVQAMGLTTPPAQDHLGIQSPHESRPPVIQEPLIDNYHSTDPKDHVHPRVSTSNLVQDSHNQNSNQPSFSGSSVSPNSVPSSSRSSACVNGSSNMISIPPPVPSARLSPRSSSSCTSSHPECNRRSPSVSPSRARSTIATAGPAPVFSNIREDNIQRLTATVHPRPTVPQSSNTARMSHQAQSETAPFTVSPLDGQARRHPAVNLLQHGSNTVFVDEMEEMI